LHHAKKGHLQQALFWPKFTLQTTPEPFNATVIDSKAINAMVAEGDLALPGSPGHLLWQIWRLLWYRFRAVKHPEK
jgi:hypothetical protein